MAKVVSTAAVQQLRCSVQRTCNLTRFADDSPFILQMHTVDNGLTTHLIAYNVQAP